MKIDKKTREGAALICAIAASGGTSVPDSAFRSSAYGAVAYCLESSDPALILALDAWAEAVATCGDYEPRQIDAEAEALIRTGWTP